MDALPLAPSTSPSTSISIECLGLTRRFGSTVAVDDVTLHVRRGEVLALLGPSGCGKTTLLRLMAGYETPDAGVIRIRGREVVAPGLWVPPEKRQIGFVFQDYALFPHLSVGGNVAFGLRDLPRPDRRKRVDAMLALVGLEGVAARMPHQLSGGQQQRVALARALAPDPDVVLLDEPFSNLDAGLRRQVRQELQGILAAAGATAVFVTHDQEEALNLGSSVAIMRRGKILEVGSPRDIYLRPAHRETAEIIGTTNVIQGESFGITVRCSLGQLPIAHPCRLGPMDILVRPESIRLRPLPVPESPDAAGAEGVVEDLQFHGSHQHIVVRVPGGELLRVRVGPEQSYQTGQRVHVRVPDPVICFSRGE